MTQRIYPNPPIVEAVIDFRFDPLVGADDVLQALRANLADRYDAPVLRQQDLIEAQVSASEGQLSTSARRSPHMIFLESSSGVRLLGCGTGMLSIHVLAPYPGWENFIEQAREAVAALPEELRESNLHRIGIRYVDLIRLPEGDEFGRFLSIMPKRPHEMPPLLTGCYYVTQSVDPDDDTRAQLIVASTHAPDHPGSALVYDLTVFQLGSPLCAFVEDSWLPRIDEMHVRLRNIFENSITDQTRELFK